MSTRGDLFSSIAPVPVPSISCRFAGVAAVILPAQKLAGYGIDCDALTVRPVAAAHAKVVTHGAERVSCLLAESRLEVELVGQVLMVEARSVNRLLDVQAAFGGRQKDVDDGRDNASPARRAENVTKLAVFKHNGRRH